MAIGVCFDLLGVTQEQYDEVAERLADGRGLNRRSDLPVEGLLVHVAGATENGWRVVDVWESEEAFDRFGKKLGLTMSEVGISGRPTTFPIHNLVIE